MNFTKRKFLSFKPVTKHVKSSQLLKSIYLELLNYKRLNKDLISSYQDIEKWLKLKAMQPTLASISDRYHYHLSMAEIDATDSNLLPISNHLDKPSNAPYLPIDIYLDHVRSLHNVGSIMRTIEAFRLGTLCIDEQMINLKHPKLKKTSMGTENAVPIKSINSVLDLKKPLIGIEITETSTCAFDFTFPESFSLLFGNEEYGLSKRSLDQCDKILHIPLFGQKNSLNVSCAFAIVASLISKTLRSQ